MRAEMGSPWSVSHRDTLNRPCNEQGRWIVLSREGILFQQFIQLAAQLLGVKAKHQLHLSAVAAQAVRRKEIGRAHV